MKKSNSIHSAIIFASLKHDGQKRKGTNIPYISHPMEVMQILTQNGCSEAVIIAGILHDTLEDTKATTKEIKNLFGSEILAIVASESEDKSKMWKERKQRTINELAKAPVDTKLVCCADKLSNIRSMYADKLDIGDKLWERFNAGKDDIRWYYESLVNQLAGLGAYQMYQELKELVGIVF
jgi:(p)ppGpp synthase/HD superfamily hydrolase